MSQVNLREYAKTLMPFTAPAPQESVGIDILCDVVRISRNNCYLLVITDRVLKLTRTVSLKEISATTVA